MTIDKFIMTRDKFSITRKKNMTRKKQSYDGNENLKQIVSAGASQ
jgi:hypothetical protein